MATKATAAEAPTTTDTTQKQSTEAVKVAVLKQILAADKETTKKYLEGKVILQDWQAVQKAATELITVDEKLMILSRVVG